MKKGNNGCLRDITFHANLTIPTSPASFVNDGDILEVENKVHKKSPSEIVIIPHSQKEKENYLSEKEEVHSQKDDGSYEDGSACTPLTFDSLHKVEKMYELKSCNRSLKEDNKSLRDELRRIKTRMDAVKSSSAMQIKALELRLRDTGRVQANKGAKSISTAENDGRLYAIQALKKAALKQEESLHIFRHKLSQAKRVVREKDDKIDKLESEITELKVKDFSTQKELSASKEEIASLRDRLENSVHELTNLKEKDDNVTDNDVERDLRKELEAIRKDLESKIQTIVTLELEIEECKDELEEERAGRRSDCLRMKEEVISRYNLDRENTQHRSTDAMEKSKKQIASLELECETYKGESISFKDEVDRLREENLALREHLTSLQATVKEYQYNSTDVSVAVTEINRLQATLLNHTSDAGSSFFDSTHDLSSRDDAATSFYTASEIPEKSVHKSSIERITDIKYCDETRDPPLTKAISTKSNTGNGDRKATRSTKKSSKTIWKTSKKDKSNGNGNRNGRRTPKFKELPKLNELTSGKKTSKLKEQTYVFETPTDGNPNTSFGFRTPKWSKSKKSKKGKDVEF